MDNFSKDYFSDNKNSNYILNYHYLDNDRYWSSIINAIKKYNINGKMLDIGCAYGYLLKRIIPYFSEIHGIDLSDFAVKKTKETVPCAYVNKLNLNCEDILYPDKYFNLITALDVLEHTESIEKTLQKIIPKLKDNGYLIISIPLKDTWAGKIWKFLDKDPTHINIPTKNDLFDILEQQGLNIIEKMYFYNLTFFKLKNVPVNIEIILNKK